MAFHFKAKLFSSIFSFSRLHFFFLFSSSLQTGKTPQQVQVVEYTEKSQDKHETRHVQLVREYGFHPRSKVQVVDGALLPRKFEPFPEDMYGRPLEEIDSCIYEEVSRQQRLIIILMKVHEKKAFFDKLLNVFDSIRSR